MSDWLTHVGATYGPGRLFLPDRLRLVLIGAVLPDAGTPFVVLANRLHFHPGAVETYLQPLQAPLPTLLLALALALLTPGWPRSLAAIGLGAAIHYLLDLSQVRYGGGIYLLYPASYWSPSLGLYWPESPANLGLLGLGALGTVWALVQPGPRIRWTGARAGTALAALALALALPLLTRPAFTAANANNVAFFRNPGAFGGRTIALAQSEVVGTRPDGDGFAITIRKGARRILIRAAAFERWGRVTRDPPALGARISLRGVYRDGSLRAGDPVHVHVRPLRTWTSLTALLLLAILLVLPDRRSRAFEAGAPAGRD